MPEADRGAIFRPFHRVAGTSNVAGLGLAIAQQLVVAHRGAIVAHNSPGDGLCVVITVPAALVPRA